MGSLLSHVISDFFLHSVKDDLHLKTPGVYNISSQCGHSGHSIDTNIKEHNWHNQFYHLEKSHVAEHSIKLGGHHIQFHDTNILTNKSGCMDCLI